MSESTERLPLSPRIRETFHQPDALLLLTLAPATLLNAFSTLRFGHAIFNPPCLITLLTGHPCPGCGLTRAISQLWLGHFREAILLNPLSPLVLSLLLVLFAHQLGRLVVYQRKLLHIKQQQTCVPETGAARRHMAEFSVFEQMQLTEGMSEQQKFVFQAQYGSVRRDRTLVLLISIFLGYLGIDRFLVGDIGLGVLKLLTGGVCGILWLIDIFLITGRVDDYNRRKAQEIAMFVKINTPPI